jgi:hypothetical protein
MASMMDKLTAPGHAEELRNLADMDNFSLDYARKAMRSAANQLDRLKASASRTPMNPDILNLPDSREKNELLWCASIASLVDWNSSDVDLLCLARAANVATDIAIRLLKERDSP